MATSKGRGGAAAKSASKKSASKKSAAGAGNRTGSSASRNGAPSKAAASRGGKATAAKKSAPAKAAAPKKATATKSAASGRSGGARNGTASKSAAGRGRTTGGSTTSRGAAASRSASAKASASGARARGAKASSDPRNDLEKILQDLMQDIYYAEKKLVKALGKMAKKTSNERLRDAFTTHQAQTEEQVARLEEAFEILGQKPKAKKCPAMDGLIEESEEHMQEYEKGAGLDAALIVGAQKVEHYEIASYGSMRSIADTLGYNDAARIFEEIREQESDTDELLTQIAEGVVNLQAEEENENTEEGDSSTGSGRSDNQRDSGSDTDNNDGAGRGISALTDGNDRGEGSETGPAMGH